MATKDLTARLRALQQKVADDKTERAVLEDRKSQLLDQLKGQFNVDDLESGRKKLESMQSNLEKRRTRIEKLLSELEEKVDERA